MATNRKPSNRGGNQSSSNRRQDESLVDSTQRVVRGNPYAGAAVLGTIAAAAFGFFAFKKSGKTFGQFTDDIATGARDRAGDVTERVKDGLADAGTMAKETVSKLRDGLDGEKTQSEIAEEALTLKQTGSTSSTPIDPMIEQQSKVRAISY